MKAVTAIQIDMLRKKELVYRDGGKPSGFVNIEDAINALENLEVSLLTSFDVENLKKEINGRAEY